MQERKLKKLLAIFVQIARYREYFSGAIRRKSQEVIKMKRILPLLLALALLAGCGAVTLPSDEPVAPARPELAETPYQPSGTGPFMELERETYDPSLTQYTYFIRNATEETVEFGEEYAIQRREDGVWKDLTLRKNAGFTAIGYALKPGAAQALTCSLDLYEEIPQAGSYRLVKTVGGQTLYAEFELGESAYTADTPYGFKPLEDLPETYGAAQAAESDVVFTGDGVKNDGAVEEFLYKVSLGVPCQLRTVQDYGEGAVMVIDTVYENDHFLWRVWNGGDEVPRQRYSYLVTDGADLYLSNGADWETAQRYANKELAWLVPAGTAGPAAVETVDAMTADRLAGNTARYRVWSADGAWDAFLTEDPTEFGVGWRKDGEGSGGRIYDLQDWDGLETAIWGLEWREDGKLLLFCETADGGSSRLTFDPARETMG